ncbi:response regulator transcription factor [Vibrio kasasachensis]|uniref:LuxR C-terminal-related transcriptional regulator n=1 Tax=Vibrio kasasachensis TaxID=2910248 RepID=UPI003D1491A1
MNSTKTNLVLLGSLNIQNRVVYDALREVQGVTVYLKQFNDMSTTLEKVNIDVLLLEFKDINKFNRMSLGVSLIIYNTPDEVSEVQLTKLPNLKGVLYIKSSKEHLIQCVEHVCRGDMWLPRKLMVSMLKNFLLISTPPNGVLDLLTRREQQILKHLVNGYSNQQIADKLFVTESTVKTHVYKLYRKINVRCRRDAISLVKNMHAGSKVRPEALIDTTLLEHT